MANQKHRSRVKAASQYAGAFAIVALLTAAVVLALPTPKLGRIPVAAHDKDLEACRKIMLTATFGTSTPKFDPKIPVAFTSVAIRT